MEQTETDEIIKPPVIDNINVLRLKKDLNLTKEDLQLLEKVSLPDNIRVPSTSPIKVNTVIDTLRIIQPKREFTVIGVKASSDVDEQPFGESAINGARNRLRNGEISINETPQENLTPVAWISIENGLFIDSKQQSSEPVNVEEGVVMHTKGADLTSIFDPNAEYVDRAVTVIKIPGYQTIIQISPDSEAVKFPKNAVMVAFNSEGGFSQNTVGSKLKEMGIVKNNQNPHSELTVDRMGGPLTRQDQMARVMIRGLLNIAKSGKL